MHHSSILNIDLDSAPDRTERLAGMLTGAVAAERRAHVEARGDDHRRCTMRTGQTATKLTTTVAAWTECRSASAMGRGVSA